MAEEFDEEVLVFTTDEGDEVEFVILNSLEYEGKEYILVTEDPEAEDVEVQILRLDGEEPVGDEDECIEVFNSIDDLEELKKVSKLFSDMLEDDEIELRIEE